MTRDVIGYLFLAQRDVMGDVTRHVMDRVTLSWGLRYCHCDEGVSATRLFMFGIPRQNFKILND